MNRPTVRTIAILLAAGFLGAGVTTAVAVAQTEEAPDEERSAHSPRQIGDLRSFSRTRDGVKMVAVIADRIDVEGTYSLAANDEILATTVVVQQGSRSDDSTGPGYWTVERGGGIPALRYSTTSYSTDHYELDPPLLLGEGDEVNWFSPATNVDGFSSLVLYGTPPPSTGLTVK